MKHTIHTSFIALVTAAAAAGLLGCGGGGKPAVDPTGDPVTTGDGKLVSQAAAKLDEQLVAWRTRPLETFPATVELPSRRDGRAVTGG